jgi:hypothetical protein
MTKPFTGEPTEEEMALRTYTAHITCTNCGADDNITISKGVPVKDALLGKVCKNCECGCLEKGA